VEVSLWRRRGLKACLAHSLCVIPCQESKLLKRQQGGGLGTTATPSSRRFSFPRVHDALSDGQQTRGHRHTMRLLCEAQHDRCVMLPCLANKAENMWPSMLSQWKEACIPYQPSWCCTSVDGIVFGGASDELHVTLGRLKNERPRFFLPPKVCRLSTYEATRC